MRRRLVLPALIAACLLLVIPGTAGSRSTPPATKAVLLTSFPFACEMADEGAEVRVYCWEGSNGNARHVLLDSAGEVSLTATEPLPSGLGGPGLPYGAWLTIGRFRCEVLRQGIECVLISSGKGFLITRTSIVNVQSAPGITEPAPVFGKTAAVKDVSGIVLIKEPQSFSRPLNASARVPMGSILDTTHGTVQLSTAKSAGGEIQTGRFHSGIFKVTQPTGESAAKLPEGLTILTLVGPLSPGCRQQASRRPALAESSAKREKSRLWGDAHGDFQTGGRYATVTVRGAKWLTEDTCRGTFVKVARGTVQVDDLINHRTVSVTAGHSYLASSSSTPKNKVPVLGHPTFRTRGFGRPHPREIYFGGDALSVIEKIHWHSWGPPRAVGDGTAWYLPHSAKSVSEGHTEPAKVVAFDLGACHGKLAYRKLEWFFPSHGGSFSPNRANDICF
jgi:hypothetical protein